MKVIASVGVVLERIVMCLLFSIIVFGGGMIVFTLFWFISCGVITMLFGVEYAHQFTDFINATIGHYFNNNMQLFGWASLVPAWFFGIGYSKLLRSDA